MILIIFFISMSHHIFNLEELDNFSEKLNLDELYEKKREHDLRKLEVFNKILNRIHHKIKLTSRQKLDEQYCWFVVPETMIGIPKYDQGACIAYILDKLKTNGFVCRYLHPNVLFISWKHWIPSYVRNEIKKKTGMVVDGYGNKVIKNNNSNNNTDPEDPNTLMFQNNNNSISIAPKNDFKSVSSYKPSGLIYSDDLLNKIGSKFK